MPFHAAVRSLVEPKPKLKRKKRKPRAQAIDQMIEELRNQKANPVT